MERDFGPDDAWIDDLGSPTDHLLDVLPRDPGDVGALPPPEEPGRGAGPLPVPANPELGPWFPLSMAVLIASGALGMAAASGLTGGQAVAGLLIAGFLTVYVAFLCIGAAWFDRWRRD